jgi:hypothetical protein
MRQVPIAPRRRSVAIAAYISWQDRLLASLPIAAAAALITAIMWVWPR